MMSDGESTKTEPSPVTTETEGECEQSEPVVAGGGRGKGRGRGRNRVHRGGRGRGSSKAGRPKKQQQKEVCKTRKIVKTVQSKRKKCESESEETFLSPESRRIEKAQSDWNASQKKTVLEPKNNDDETSTESELVEIDQQQTAESLPKSNGLTAPWTCFCDRFIVERLCII